jgi:hypothetical protein
MRERTARGNLAAPGGGMLPAPLGRSGNITSFSLPARSKTAVTSVLALAAVSMLTLTACGSKERQDADEPTGDYPVAITKAVFPARQALAGTTNLVLGVKNAGDKTIPQLVVTISADPDADESFSVHSKQPGLAIPSRPVWVLEEGYPKLAGEAAPAGADSAQTKSFNFGPLDAGQSRVMVWRVTPTVAGTWTVDYRIAAGLEGKAKAETPDGNVPEGQFVVKISDVPPQTRVDDAGNVVPIEPGDIIGQAGSDEQRREVGK